MSLFRGIATKSLAWAVRLLQLAVHVGPRSEIGSGTDVLILQYVLPLGSCLHMTPVYEGIKRSRPNARITVATRGVALLILRRSPFVDHLIETPDPFKNLAATIMVLRSELRHRGIAPDCVLTGAPDQRTKIALVAAMVCAGWRGGFTVSEELYQRPLRYEYNESQIQNNLRLVTLLGDGVDGIEPRLLYSGSEAMAAKEALRPIWDVNQPVLVVVSRNSGGQKTGWNNKKWVTVLQYAHNILGYALVYVGTADEVRAVDLLRQEVGGMHLSLAGKTSIGVLAAVLALSDMVLTIDTGTMHVGRSVRVPMIVLAPSWQRAWEWLPLGHKQVRVLRGPDRKEVPSDYQLDEISSAMVEAALTELTEWYPSSAEAREERLNRGLSDRDLLPMRL